MTTTFPPFLSNSDVSSSTVTSPAVISIKPTLTDLTSAFKPFDFFGGRAANVDNLAALNNWVAYGGPVLIPAGRFAVSATPNTLTNQSAAMVGLGDGASMFVFAGGGLSFSQDSFAHVTHVRDLSLLTTSIDVGTALTYADAAADIVAQRFQHRVSIQRVGIRGDTITTQGWAKGLSMTDPQCVLLDTLTITGRNNSTTENTRAGYGHMTSGIEIIGTAEIATDIDLRHPRMNNCQNGVMASGHIEGLRLSGGLLVNVWAGVNVNMASLRPGYNIDGTHINFFDFGVKLANVAQAKITNCLMYKHPVSTAASVAISLSGGCSIIAIESNQCINETPDFATGGAWTFASLTNSDFCLIQDNEIERPSAVTVFGTGTTNTRAWNNTALGTLSGTAFVQHTDTSGNGTNTADAVGFPVSFTGPVSVSGSATFTQPVLGSWNGALNIGQFYATPVSGRSAVFGSDGALGYLTDAPSAGAPFSAHRPLAWNLATGDLSIAADGASTTVGGRVTLASGLGVFGRSPPSAQPTISGSRSGNAALGSLLTALGATGLIMDGSSGTLSPQEYGYIGDGASHPASSKFASLAAAQAVYPSCLSLADEIDGLAIQTALTNLSGVGAAAELLLPTGQGRISRSLTVTLTGNTVLSIHGAGSDVSELLFIGDTDGIVVTYASNASFTRDTTTGTALKVNGISVIRGPATTGKDGIRIIGDSANASGTIQPDTVFNDVVVRGGANGGSWTNCIIAQDAANTSWFHVLCQGSVTASGSSPTRGIGTAGIVLRTTGSRYATQHNFSHCAFNILGRGLDIYERIQGVAVTNCNFTAGLYGIYWNSNGRQEQLAVSNSQFSVLLAGIYAYNMQNIAVSSSVFYNQNTYVVPVGSANNWAGVQFAECDNCAIVGNNFMGGNIATEWGIQITNDTALVPSNRPSVISGNTFFGLSGQALYTRNNTTNINFVGNTIDNNGGFPPIGADAGTFPVCVANTFTRVPFLLGFPGSAQMQVYGGTDDAAPLTFASRTVMTVPFQMAGYNFASIPSAVTYNGHTIRVVDRSQRLATSDGTNWRFGDGIIVT